MVERTTGDKRPIQAWSISLRRRCFREKIRRHKRFRGAEMTDFFIKICRDLLSLMVANQDPAAYASVFQLAVALNLVLSGYAEIRLDLEDKIDNRIQRTRERINEALHHDRVNLLDDRNQNDASTLSGEWHKKFKKFTKTYNDERKQTREDDQKLVERLIIWSLLGFVSLLVVSFFAGEKTVPNVCMIVWSLALYAPAAYAIRRALVLIPRTNEHWKTATELGGDATHEWHRVCMPYCLEKEWKKAKKARSRQLPQVKK